jgi:hypothetical protein
MKKGMTPVFRTKWLDGLFLGFGNIWGIQHYGKTEEYNNDADLMVFGVFGMNRFFQYMKTVLIT